MAEMVVATLVYNHIPKLRKELQEKAAEVVRKTAFDIEADAKSNAAVDTGAMKNSIYAATDEGSNYSGRAAEARSARPEIVLLGQAEKPKALEAVVAVGAEYAVYVEMGTSRMAARPFLAPAAERARPAFQKAMDQVVK